MFFHPLVKTNSTGEWWFYESKLTFLKSKYFFLFILISEIYLTYKFIIFDIKNKQIDFFSVFDI